MVSYSHHSIKRTGSIKRPGLKIFKKSLLNVPYHQKNEGLIILSYCLYKTTLNESILQKKLYLLYRTMYLL